jgi:hypothetical protein
MVVVVIKLVVLALAASGALTLIYVLAGAAKALGT